MKKTALLIFLSIASFVTYAQLAEDFNTSCASASSPSTWTIYNPLSATSPQGEWHCTSTNGRPTGTGIPTPGVECTGYYSSANHLDTSYLITPIIYVNHTTYPGGHAYVRFDTKKDLLTNGAKVAVEHMDSFSTGLTTFTGTVTPAFSSTGDTGWVTRELDISNYLDSPSFRVAFRYTSATTTGTIWYMDNVVIVANSLSINEVSKQMLPITVVGDATSSKVTVSYTTEVAGNYRIAMYDMMGREVYSTRINTRSGTSSYIMNDLSLRPGMYCIKIGNENTYGTTKLMIQ